jgi:hypothetical protein
MRIDYSHPFSIDDARTRLEALGDYLNNRHGIKIGWDDPNTASFNGKYLVVHIEGEMKLGEGMVKLRGKDPGMLWRKKAKKYLERKLSEYLDPAIPIDDLPRNK